jgi:hypothetical protein
MKRIACLFFLVLCSAVLVLAQNASVPKNMNAAVCNSACVTKVNNVPTCDTECTDRSGHCIAVTNGGRLTKVADRQECKGLTHEPEKPSKAPKQTEKQREQELRAEELYRQGP